jgi:hypothetical protein
MGKTEKYIRLMVEALRAKRASEARNAETDEVVCPAQVEVLQGKLTAQIDALNEVLKFIVAK